MSILDDILLRTRAEVRVRQERVPLGRLEKRCKDLPPTRDFARALRRRAGGRERREGRLHVIAEIKKASPSKGVIRSDFVPPVLARAYAQAGADALSVLTDAPFFQGSLEDLIAVREAVTLPILRKDFHVESYQLWEARAAGADAVLLIAAAMLPERFATLLTLARQLGLGVLAEVHTPQELEVVLGSGANVVGINNRDLATFQVSLEKTFTLLPLMPVEVIAVSESGISQSEEVGRLASAGVDAVLVGESLLRDADPGRALQSLMGGA